MPHSDRCASARLCTHVLDLAFFLQAKKLSINIIKAKRDNAKAILDAMQAAPDR